MRLDIPSPSPAPRARVTLKPLPHVPEVAALVQVGVRAYEIVACGGRFDARLHLRADTWAHVARAVSWPDAFDAIGAHVQIVEGTFPDADADARAALSVLSRGLA